PTREAEDEEKESFYNDLEAACDEAPRHDVKIILGDMNAKAGREPVYRLTIGKESLHEETNDNGFRLIRFAMSKGMTISSTWFPHKCIHKATWRSMNQIDQVLIKTGHGSDILDVRSYRGANIDSDHFLKNEWGVIKRTVLHASEEVVGCQVVNRREAWFDDECRVAIAERNEARKKMLQRPTRTSTAEFSSKRTLTKRLCRQRKTEWQNQKLQEYYNKEMRQVYQKI
uniref:Endonuclease/exonuclease/phosphatase domain-containing protein n=1 Tax=Lepisosteus oculatus TaxID=7918 RepID=W5M2S5_LEPOC